MPAGRPSPGANREWGAIRNSQYRKVVMAVALLLGLRLTYGLFLAGGAKSQSALQSDQRLQPLIRSVEGPELFRAYCASCHGEDAKGNGPAAAALKAKVPDLTELAKRNKGQFPAALVRKVIMGDEVLASHGSRAMPIWGPIFHQVEADVDRGYVRQENLVKYLESIQSIARPATQEKRVSSSAAPSGEELYKHRCAACHGNDLKGNGPAPPPFREFPPDLTTLAKRNGGEFPDTYIAEVLRSGAPIPEHGPAEMPVWGAEFKESENLDETQIESRITNLSNYIKSLQEK